MPEPQPVTAPVPATTEPPAPRRSRRDSRRPQLLDAAARRFRRGGYSATSMRDIAGDAGMLAGSMYHHFPSKEDLLVAVHEEGIRRITKAVEEALDGVRGPWQRLEAAAAAHLAVLLDGGDYAVVVIRELPHESAALRRTLAPVRDAYEDIFRRLVDDLPLSAATPRHHVRLMLLGALNWSQTWYRPGGEAPEAIARGFIRLLRGEH